MHAELDGNDGAAVIEAAKLASGSQRDEGSEHVVIGRLIRRLRVSEPPDRFHPLATNVLRSSLGVEAVAWVPRESREPVIVSGAVDGLEPSSYRALAQSGNRDGTAIHDEVSPGRRSRGIPDSVRAVRPGSLPVRPAGSSR